MHLDLFKSRDRWLDGIKALSKTFADLEAEFPRELQAQWRLFWDHQLYKARWGAA